MDIQGCHIGSQPRGPSDVALEVAQPFALGFQILGVLVRRADDERNPFDDGDRRSIEGRNLVGVVRQQPDRPNAQVFQNVDGDRVIPLVRLESKVQIRVNRIQPFILQIVGAELVDEANSPTLLAQVDQDPGRRFTDSGERARKLLATVAPAGTTTHRRSDTRNGPARAETDPRRVAPS